MHFLAFRGGSGSSVDPLARSKDAALDELKKSFLEANDMFYTAEHGLSLSSEINNRFSRYIFDAYPELGKLETIIDVSNALESRLEVLKAKICKELATSENYRTSTIPHGIPKDASSYFEKEPETRIISTVMGLEYEARMNNKALLLRGTDLIAQKFDAQNFEEETQRILLGSTVVGDKKSISVKDILTSRQNKPYSISLANSLFAGFYQDPGGCTYYYLNGRSSLGINIYGEPEEQRILGYGLLVDQQEYIKDGNKGLFYIPSIAPLTSLFERGQYCHPRTRVAVLDLENARSVKGLLRKNDRGEIDPANIIIFKGDPVKHEEKFTAFVAKNGRLIEQQNIDPDKKLVESIIPEHAKLSKTYQKIRVVGLKTLRVLLRIGDQKIPGVSEIDLFEMLEHGATPQQYARLQSALSSMKFEPVSSQGLSMSSQDLYNSVIVNRYPLFLADTIHTDRIKNSFLEDFFEEWASIINNMMNESQVHRAAQSMKSVMVVLNKALFGVDIQSQTNALRFLRLLQKEGLFLHDEINYLMQSIAAGLNSPDKELQKTSIHVIGMLIQHKLFQIKEIDKLLQFVQKGLGSSHEDVKAQAMRLLLFLLNQAGSTDLSYDLMNRLIDMGLIGREQVNQLMEWASKGIDSYEEIVQLNLVKLVLSLADKNLIGREQVTQVMSLVDKVINSPFHVQLNSMKLVLSLADKNLIGREQVAQVMSLVNKGINSTRETMNVVSVDIIDKLIKSKLLDRSDIQDLLSKLANVTHLNDVDISSLKVKLQAELSKQDVKNPVHAHQETNRSMFRFNRGLRPDQKFMAEAKRQYSMMADKMKFDAQQQLQMEQMERGRTQLEAQREHLQNTTRQLNVFHPDVPVAKIDPMLHRPEMASAEMIAASRAAAAARRSLPRVARSVIR